MPALHSACVSFNKDTAKFSEAHSSLIKLLMMSTIYSEHSRGLLGGSIDSIPAVGNLNEVAFQVCEELDIPAPKDLKTKFVRTLANMRHRYRLDITNGFALKVTTIAYETLIMCKAPEEVSAAIQVIHPQMLLLSGIPQLLVWNANPRETLTTMREKCLTMEKVLTTLEPLVDAAFREKFTTLFYERLKKTLEEYVLELYDAGEMFNDFFPHPHDTDAVDEDAHDDEDDEDVEEDAAADADDVADVLPAPVDQQVLISNTITFLPLSERRLDGPLAMTPELLNTMMRRYPNVKSASFLRSVLTQLLAPHSKVYLAALDMTHIKQVLVDGMDPHEAISPYFPVNHATELDGNLEKVVITSSAMYRWAFETWLDCVEYFFYESSNKSPWPSNTFNF